MQDAPLQGEGDRLGAIGGTQLAEQAIDVGLDRALADPQVGADLFVAAAVLDAGEDLVLARAERLRRQRSANLAAISGGMTRLPAWTASIEARISSRGVSLSR